MRRASAPQPAAVALALAALALLALPAGLCKPGSSGGAAAPDVDAIFEAAFKEHQASWLDEQMELLRAALAAAPLHDSRHAGAARLLLQQPQLPPELAAAPPEAQQAIQAAERAWRDPQEPKHAQDLKTLLTALLAKAAAPPDAAAEAATAATAAGGGDNSSTITEADGRTGLGAADSFPVTRRLVIGYLAAARLRAGTPWSQDQAASVAAIASLLHALHVRGARAKSAVEFMHVSKAAGTSVCQAARANGCSAQSFEPAGRFGNCLVREFDDVPRWASIAYHRERGLPRGKRLGWEHFGRLRGDSLGCRGRLATLRRGGWSFYANEYTLAAPSPVQPTAVCPQMLTLLVFRHPEQRLLSHMRHMASQLSRFYGRGVLARSGYLAPAANGGNGSSDAWLRFAPAVVDNYYVRSLLGEAVFHAPPGSLDQAHLRQAAARLVHIDVILGLEDQDADELALRRGLGWRVGLAALPRQRLTALDANSDDASSGASAGERAASSSTSSHVSKNAMKSNGGGSSSSSSSRDQKYAAQALPPLPADVGVLLQRNGLDAALHSLARALIAIDSFVFKMVDALEQRVEHQKRSAAGDARALPAGSGGGGLTTAAAQPVVGGSAAMGCGYVQHVPQY